MLAKVGITVNLNVETKVTYFPKILSRNTSFYMLGWTPTTYDAHNPLLSVVMTPAGEGRAGAVQPGQLQQQARR